MLVTVEELLEWINDPSVDRHDQTLRPLIARVTRFLEGRLERHLDGKEATVVRRFGLNSPSPRLILPDVILAPDPKLAADPLFEFRYGVDEAFTPLDSAVDLEFVDVDDRTGVYTYALRRNGTNWPCGDDLVRATYKTGYDYDTAPLEIKEAVLDVASVWWRRRVTATASATEALTKDQRRGRVHG